MNAAALPEITLHGIKASPGIDIGIVYIFGDLKLDADVKKISSAEVEEEVSRFKVAVKASAAELSAIISKNKSPEDMRILEAHKLLLNDKRIYDSTISLIQSECINAEIALNRVVSKIRSNFEDISDSYIKERAMDITQVADRIQRNLSGIAENSLGDVGGNVILVAKDLSPADTMQLNLQEVKGFVTAMGSRTSHTTILAQSMELPAVVGLGEDINRVREGMLAIIDGTNGVLVLEPTVETLEEYAERKRRYDNYIADVTTDSALPAITADGVEIIIRGNIELLEDVRHADKYGCEGIGLYRTEFAYMQRAVLPREEELFEQYRDIVKAMNGKPVVFRTLDINADKVLPSLPNYDEMNPALGLRAIRYCLRNPDVFKTQLKAMMRAAHFGDVRILLPMICTLSEIQRTKQLLAEAVATLKNDGVPFKERVPLGVMIEVPSAVVMADQIAKAVDFLSVGTNDLIQYAFAVDRNNKYVSEMYQPLNPAILRMLHKLITISKEFDVPITICGEMAGQPLYIPLLMGMGFREISMNVPSIPLMKRFLKSVSVAEAEAFTRHVLDNETSTRKIYEMVLQKYGPLIATEFNASDEAPEEDD